MHMYKRATNSEAGNCICGFSEFHVLHPHDMNPALKNPMICVCSKSHNWHGHNNAER